MEPEQKGKLLSKLPEKSHLSSAGKTVVLKDAHKFATTTYELPIRRNVKSVVVDDQKKLIVVYTSQSQGAYWNLDRFTPVSFDEGISCFAYSLSDFQRLGSVNRSTD
jgi:hypothetical protein